MLINTNFTPIKSISSISTNNNNSKIIRASSNLNISRQIPNESNNEVKSINNDIPRTQTLHSRKDSGAKNFASEIPVTNIIPFNESVIIDTSFFENGLNSGNNINKGVHFCVGSEPKQYCKFKAFNFS